MAKSEQEHIDPTSEISLETVKKRSVSGVLALTGRTLVLNLISFAAQGFLWAFLEPSAFGIFWVVSAVVNFLTYFSDIGLAASLIQKKEEPSDADLKTTFTVQQSLVIVSLVILFLVTPVLKNTHSLSPEAVTLLYALGISFLLSSLKSIPSVLLERELSFGKLIIPQVFETLIYNLAVVFFAWKGLGITSFTYAVLIRGVIGLVLVYIIKPWKPGLSFSTASLKDLLRFGIPYQINTFLAVLKDDGMTIILGSLLGPTGMGILGTARKLAQYPLRFFMDNVTRVTFPAFSRMQEDKDQIARSLTKSIFFITFLVFPATVGLAVLAPIIVEAIPRYAKWTPALIPLAIVSVDTIFASFTTQLTNLLNAIGKIKTTFKLMIIWTFLTFLSVPVLSIRFGVTGASIGYALVSISSIYAVYLAKREVNFSLTESIGRTAFSAALMGLVLLILRKFLPADLGGLGLLTLIGGVVYLSCVFLFMGVTLIKDVQKTFVAIFRNG
ncbi:MAG: Polysaccharide biosynthesis protein [Candidatus Woesebacteria bacterium GW2011_GWB1_45_5]|uniref:Polysaccharide biosynthesis protein n=1 Tax=Candidatus Woesebacteria bacterium GW2011_GWB1_45_5 TaxID=1618581 RepID=A0A0G1MRU5_9BACT|nr:MAG: Polysaccharide biosynthesis protein [Candidatus Woesebacteria bacterium GW2011_GWB1_45_5]